MTTNLGSFIQLPDDFGNSKATGAQHKGAATINNNALYVKLDDISPSLNSSWEDSYDFKYSCVSETIASIFARNIQNNQNFDCADYRFAEFEYNNDMSTGTYAENYLKAYEIEHVLSIDKRYADKQVANRTLMSIDDYEDNIHNAPLERKWNTLLSTFGDVGIAKEDATEFLTKQAAFDIILGNTDRINNPSNFVFVHNVKTQTTRPINMDFGRTLQLGQWSDQAELMFEPEWLEEDINSYNTQISNFNRSILGGSKDENLAFLKKQGFTGFNMDKDVVLQELDDLRQDLILTNPPFINFALAKIRLAEERFNDPYFNQFVNNVKAPEKTQELKPEVTFEAQPQYSAPVNQNEHDNALEHAKEKETLSKTPSVQHTEKPESEFAL